VAADDYGFRLPHSGLGGSFVNRSTGFSLSMRIAS